jgi:hypothetical protein
VREVDGGTAAGGLGVGDADPRPVALAARDVHPALRDREVGAGERQAR